jgi:hypothetical protein
MAELILDEPLRWPQIAAIANGRPKLALGPNALARLGRVREVRDAFGSRASEKPNQSRSKSLFS